MKGCDYLSPACTLAPAAVVLRTTKECARESLSNLSIFFINIVICHKEPAIVKTRAQEFIFFFLRLVFLSTALSPGPSEISIFSLNPLPLLAF